MTDSGPADREHVGVTLRPLLSDSAAVGEFQRQIHRQTLSSRINEWGYFVFPAVAAGTYALEVELPGFQLGRVSPLVLRDSDDFELANPVVLRPAPNFEITVNPPRDSRRRPWSLTLLGRRDGSSQLIEEGRTSAQGVWISPPLAEGSYEVQVFDGDGQRFYWDDDLILTQPAQPLEIDLPLVEVYGVVEFRDEPLAGRLVFGGRRGLRGEQISAAADAEGKFSVVLPRPGKWHVDVEADDPAVTALLLSVEIERRPDKRPTRVEIVVPDTAVHGTVTDDQGQLAGGASILLFRYEPIPVNTVLRGDARGEFSIYGQSPGRLFLQATGTSGAESDPLEVLLTEGEAAPLARLVVHGKRLVRGRIVSEAGAVAGAQVRATAASVGAVAAPPTITKATSDLDGVFQVKVAGNAREVQLIVLAVGHPLALWRAPLGEEAVVSLVLDDASGSLRLPNVDSQGESRVGRHSVVLVGGEVLDVKMLKEWARSSAGSLHTGEVLTIPAMPPGTYRYCELTTEEAFLVFAGAALPGESACSAGYLAAGGVLTLAAPESR
jgi:hypothetical protein